MNPLLHASPAVGFEQPFEMLAACHERVQRSLALLGRLCAYVEAKGHDEQSRSAARDVLRYFDLAAPQHHADEERHVFPRLRDAGDSGLEASAATLERDHRRMEALWAALRGRLESWALPAAAGPVPADWRAAMEEFRALYATHIALEESVAFPTARSRTDAAGERAMSEEMSSRRRVA